MNSASRVQARERNAEPGGAPMTGQLIPLWRRALDAREQKKLHRRETIRERYRVKRGALPMCAVSRKYARAPRSAPATPCPHRARFVAPDGSPRCGYHRDGSERLAPDVPLQLLQGPFYAFAKRKRAA